MTDLARSFALAVLLPVLAMLLWSLIHTTAGTVGHGPFWLECVQ